MEQTKSIRVAICDPNTLFRKGLASLLPTLGNYEVVLEASEGKDLLKNLSQRNVPQICIIDPMLSNTKFNVVEELKWRWRDTKVLCLSTYSSEYTVIKMLQAGANGYIPKESTEAQLVSALDDIASKGYHYSKIANKTLFEKIYTHKAEIPPIREFYVRFLAYLCQGLTYEEIGEKMGRDVRTVEGYAAKLTKKLKLRNKVELVMFALRTGLTQVKGVNC
jgi:DNA-binding NarL/FixJ family response regulator